MAERRLVAAPPGVHRRQPQRLTQQALAQLRQERQQRRVLQHPGADGVDHADRALPDALQQPGHPQPRSWAQLERVHPGRVDPAQDHVDLLQLAQRAHPHPAVADGQVAALQQREAEQGGHEGLVEGGLGVRAWAEYHDPRVLHGARRRVDQGQPHRGEERGQPVEVGGVVDLGQHPGHHPTVLHRESGPRRGLGAVGDHLPLAGRVPAEVGGGHDQAPPRHRLDTDHGAQVLVVVKHRRRRENLTSQQPARSVEVSQDRVQQLGPLHHAGLQAGPLPVVQDQRQGVQPPGLGLAEGHRRRVGRRVRDRQLGGRAGSVGDVVVLQQPGDLALGPDQVGGLQRIELPEQHRPSRPRRPIGRGELVEYSGGRSDRLGELGQIAAENGHPRPQRTGRWRRRSSVTGYSSGSAARHARAAASAPRSTTPVVCPTASNRTPRRASASAALTGGAS